MILRSCIMIGAVLFLVACATAPEPQTPSLNEATPVSQSRPPPVEIAPPSAPPTTPPVTRTELYPGTGVLVKPPKSGRQPSPAMTGPGTITLNFELADVREVVKFILGDTLQQNYLVDPQVQGVVTLQTSRPLPAEALIPVLEDVLRRNNAVLVQEDGMYKILPLESALQGSVSPQRSTGRMDVGFEVRVVPLRYIGAQEMQKILEPFLPPGGLVRLDKARNLLILAGTPQELAQLQETIEIFDVDWLEGMSVGLFPLRNVEVGTITEELDQLFGEASGSPLAGVLQLVPLERLNAVLAITPQPAYLQKAAQWIRRLDRTRDVNRPRLFVYRMQHASAVDVAEVIGSIFGESVVGAPAPPEASLIPGSAPVEVGPDMQLPPGAGGPDSPPPAAPAVGEGGGGIGLQAEELRIVADEPNNALLVLATPRDYEAVEAALRQLDIPPLQVLVDASIVEVSLTGELRYGVQWFIRNEFKNNTPSDVGVAELNFGERGVIFEEGGNNIEASGIARGFPGFNYSIVDAMGIIRAVLNMLAEESRINVLSAPSVMVLDNQSAIIKVGDQVPVRLSEATRVDSADPVQTSTIGYRDTGVILEVTPRVNAGGMVVMEIEQEVNDVAETTSSGIDSPTFTQRRINSTVSVQSGETIVLGGLIRENRTNSKSGIPGLYKMPVLGPLFGQTSRDTRRTELIVLITPRVAQNIAQVREITDEFRRKVTRLAIPETLYRREPR